MLRLTLYSYCLFTGNVLFPVRNELLSNSSIDDDTGVYIYRQICTYSLPSKVSRYHVSQTHQDYDCLDLDTGTYYW